MASAGFSCKILSKSYIQNTLEVDVQVLHVLNIHSELQYYKMGYLISISEAFVRIKLVYWKVPHKLLPFLC